MTKVEISQNSANCCSVFPYGKQVSRDSRCFASRFTNSQQTYKLHLAKAVDSTWGTKPNACVCLLAGLGCNNRKVNVEYKVEHSGDKVHKVFPRNIKDIKNSAIEKNQGIYMKYMLETVVIKHMKILTKTKNKNKTKFQTRNRRPQVITSWKMQGFKEWRARW